MGSCRARSVYLTTRLLGRLSPLSGKPVLCTFFCQKLTTAHLESAYHSVSWDKQSSWKQINHNTAVECYKCTQGYSSILIIPLSRDVTKCTSWRVLPAKTKTSLRTRAVWFEPSFSVLTNIESLSNRRVLNKDAVQKARICGLIWLFTGSIFPKVFYVTLWLISVLRNCKLW